MTGAGSRGIGRARVWRPAQQRARRRPVRNAGPGNPPPGGRAAASSGPGWRVHGRPDACAPASGTPVIISVRDLARVAGEHAADAAAACCHNAGTARIPRPRRDRNLGHRRPAPHAIRACARRTHLGYLLNRRPASRVGHPVATHRSSWPGRPHRTPSAASQCIQIGGTARVLLDLPCHST